MNLYNPIIPYNTNVSVLANNEEEAANIVLNKYLNRKNRFGNCLEVGHEIKFLIKEWEEEIKIPDTISFWGKTIIGGTERKKRYEYISYKIVLDDKGNPCLYKLPNEIDKDEYYDDCE